MTVTASGCGTSEHNIDTGNALLFATRSRGVVIIVVVEGVVDVVDVGLVVGVVVGLNVVVGVVVDLDVVVGVVDLDVVVGVVVDVVEVVVLSQPNQASVGLVSLSNGCTNTF